VASIDLAIRDGSTPRVVAGRRYATSSDHSSRRPPGGPPSMRPLTFARARGARQLRATRSSTRREPDPDMHRGGDPLLSRAGRGAPRPAVRDAPQTGTPPGCGCATVPRRCGGSRLRRRVSSLRWTRYHPLPAGTSVPTASCGGNPSTEAQRSLKTQQHAHRSWCPPEVAGTAKDRCASRFVNADGAIGTGRQRNQIRGAGSTPFLNPVDHPGRLLCTAGPSSDVRQLSESSSSRRV
jgi:hypothetical protein